MAEISAMAGIDLPPWRAGPARLVTARSYMIDRAVPDCEIVALPGKEVAGGRLSYRRGKVEFAALPPEGRLARLRRRGAGVRRVEGRVLFDLRHHDPENWAHFLNNHLPIVFRLMQETGVRTKEALLVLPEAIPDYIQGAAALFGLETLATADAVTGEAVAFEMTPWTAIRTVRADWVRQPAPGEGPPLPARVFLSRRDTRRIVNEAEIAERLARRGFETVYAETLSPADQMRLFREAREIVAVHGAALAPLLYVTPEARPRRLVEILPVGHMTDVYRVMAEQVGVPWIGVRGRIRPEHVAPAYRLGQGFRQFSLDDFEVDAASLDLAFDLIGETET